jgi:hypothetical protein
MNAILVWGGSNRGEWFPDWIHGAERTKADDQPGTSAKLLHPLRHLM